MKIRIELPNRAKLLGIAEFHTNFRAHTHSPAPRTSPSQQNKPPIKNLIRAAHLYTHTQPRARNPEEQGAEFSVPDRRAAAWDPARSRVRQGRRKLGPPLCSAAAAVAARCGERGHRSGENRTTQVGACGKAGTELS